MKATLFFLRTAELSLRNLHLTSLDFCLAYIHDLLVLITFPSKR